MQRKGIDKYFREKLLGYRPKYDESLWAGIELELDQKRPKIWSKRNIMPVAMFMSFTIILSYTGTLQHSNEGLTSHSTKSNIQTQQGDVALFQSGRIYQLFAPDKLIDVNKEENTASQQIASGNISSAVNEGFARPSTSALVKAAPVAFFTNTSGEDGTGDKNIARQQVAIADQSVSKLSSFSPEQGNMVLDLVDLSNSERMNTIEESSYRNNKVQKLAPSELQSRKAGWNSIFNGFAQNPAYVGAEAKYNFNSGWNASYLEKTGNGNLASTYAYDMNLNRFGAGIYHTRALNALSLNTTTGIAASAVIGHFGNGYLRAGAAATVLYKELYFSDLHFADEADPVFGFIYSTKDKNISSRSYTNGYDAGLYYENSRLVSSFSVMNINKPSFGLLENATRLDRAYKSSIGYRVSLTHKLDITPMVELSKTGVQIMTASAHLMATYGDKFMLTMGYENFDSKAFLGNVSVNAAVNIRKKVRIFSSFGRNMQYEQLGVHQNIIRAGLRFQIH